MYQILESELYQNYIFEKTKTVSDTNNNDDTELINLLDKAKKKIKDKSKNKKKSDETLNDETLDDETLDDDTLDDELDEAPSNKNTKSENILNKNIKSKNTPNKKNTKANNNPDSDADLNDNIDVNNDEIPAKGEDELGVGDDTGETEQHTAKEKLQEIQKFILYNKLRELQYKLDDNNTLLAYKDKDGIIKFNKFLSYVVMFFDIFDYKEAFKLTNKILDEFKKIK